MVDMYQLYPSSHLINTPDRSEKPTSFASISSSRFLVAYRVGWAQGEGSSQCRFKSNPISEHLKNMQARLHTDGTK